MEPGAAAGVTIAVIFFVLCLIGGWFWFSRNNRMEGGMGLGQALLGAFGRDGDGSEQSPSAAMARAALNNKQFYDGPMTASIKFIPFAVAEKAVGGSFRAAKMIGLGGFGPVYLGRFSKVRLGPDNWHPGSPQRQSSLGSSSLLNSNDSGTLSGTIESNPQVVQPDYVECAVKLLNPQGPQSIEQYVRELQILALCEHPNLLPLLAAVNEPKKPVCLITPYMQNGPLTAHLRDPIKKAAFDWATRLRVATETAAALVFLHSANPQANPPKPKVIHRDIKPDNILLDPNMTVRVADFGLARETEHKQTATGAAGTMFYIDPEYSERGELTEKSDVYSYGIVLLQLLTGAGRPSNPKKRPPGLLARTRGKLVTADCLRIADARAQWPKSVALELGKMVSVCVARRGRQRPLMSVVLDQLKQIECAYTVAGAAPRKMNRPAPGAMR